MRAPLRIATLLLGLLLGLPAASRAQVERFATGEKSFVRFQKRIANTPQIKSLDKLLDSKSPLTGKRPVTGNIHPYNEGASAFSVDLGHGCKITGKLQRYNIPGHDVTRLKDLTVQKDGRSKQLLNGELPVNIDYDTSFYYTDRGGHVAWHGPVSKFALVSLFHELDHLNVWKSMTAAEQNAFREIYDRKTDERSLTAAQKRSMVGFERHAWAAALKEVRSLRAQGIDLLEGVSRKELMDSINGCLKGYCEYEGKKP